MSREEIAARIRWPLIIWLAGIANVMAMVPQLYSIIATRNVEGLSLGMFSTILFIQIAFFLKGFFERDKVFQISMGLAAGISIAIITLVLVIRS
ncbi:MAG: PQ-loop domain-containing transporter [bacterium]|nr:PQ-loop domain-containing transporter [bacterium]